jgi:ABC-type nitrate/sulfonate/bicarbonate transport system substrate-binding protein
LRVCMVSSAKTLQQRGDDAVKFLAAEMNALRFALTHRDETVALTREITRAKADDPRAGFVFDDAVQHKAVDPTLPIPAEKIQWIQEQMVKAGKLAKPLDLKTVTAPEYRERALKLVSPHG